MSTTRFLLRLGLLIVLAAPLPAVAGPHLLHSPAVGPSAIAFVYANDVWVVGRDGGEARRLTTFEGAETHPQFSPDGSQVAFSGEYDGNVDVYVVAASGGEPARLTWHPGDDLVVGWADAGHVLFSSGRINAPRPWPRLWAVSLQGGMPASLPAPRATTGSLSTDGRRLAFQRVAPWDSEWRNYRGGQTDPIRLLDLATLDEEKLPWEGSNDLAPLWLGDTVFFLSDRDLAMNVWAWDATSGALTQRTHFRELDCKNLGGHGDLLVVENGGELWSLSVSGGEPQRLDINLAGDFPWARPHWVEAADLVQSASLSPTGKRALFEARGEVFTVPAEHGDVRNLSRSGGAADRAPAWSPDGEQIAWFSDESGEYQLVIADQRGENRRVIPLAYPTFYGSPAWSPDSRHLAFVDADRNLWTVEVESGEAKLVDDEGSAPPQRLIHPVWSGDSKWIAYSRRLPNQFNGVFVYSLDSGRSTPVTDGLSNAHTPAWDRNGKLLYFLASTDYGLNVGWLDLSSFERPERFAIYAAVLDKGESSPLAPRSDEEGQDDAENGEADKAAAAKGKGDGKASRGKDEGDEKEKEAEKPAPVRIDFAGLSRRIVALDLPSRAYSDLQAGVAGTLFYAENVDNEPGVTLWRYEQKEREAKKLTGGVASYDVSADGEKLLYATGKGAERSYFVVAASSEIEPGKGKLDLGGLSMKVDPPAEWRQIFREAWRFQRDYFYVDNVHGLDLDWAWKTYSPWLDHVRHRADLTTLLDVLGGETSVGHSFTGGGDEPEVESVPVGLLGADLEIDQGRYRIARIYDGESWNPELEAPLSGPGIDAAAGDYLLAVNGVGLTAAQNPFSLFDHAAGQQTVLSLNRQPTLDGARQVTVVPVDDETQLRRRAWVEDNRRKVDELSGGRLAYVWVPDTGGGGFRSFTRYYFAQLDKRGAVIDERFNHGGSIADYIVDLLSRRLQGFFNNPVGERQPWTAPNAAIWGPKVMLINEMSGSGGDMLPYMFRQMEIGPLVGTRTWGGLVGIWDVPQLIDGGFITAPRGGFYDLQGKWAVENEGVPPDVEVEQEPKLVAAGHDPQLERAVAVALELLETQSVEILPQPPDPVRVRRPAATP